MKQKEDVNVAKMVLIANGYRDERVEKWTDEDVIKEARTKIGYRLLMKKLKG